MQRPGVPGKSTNVATNGTNGDGAVANGENVEMKQLAPLPPPEEAHLQGQQGLGLGVQTTVLGGNAAKRGGFGMVDRTPR